MGRIVPKVFSTAAIYKVNGDKDERDDKEACNEFCIGDGDGDEDDVVVVVAVDGDESKG